MLVEYLAAYLRRYAGDAWAAAVPGSPEIVKNCFTHDPENYVFSPSHLPALYVFWDGYSKAPETLGEDWRVQTNRYRVFWIVPPGDQLKIADWVEIYEVVASLIDTAVDRGRDPCFVIDSDPDDTAPFEGSVVERHAGFTQMLGGVAKPMRIAIKPPGGAPQPGWNVGLYDCIQTEIIGSKRPLQLFGTDPDHPEWGPSAGNAVASPAQLALSINGGAVQGFFLVGYTMLFIQDGTTPQTIGTAPSKLSGFNGVGQAAGVIPDVETDRITVQNAGTYNVAAAFSTTGTAGRRATIRLRKNGVVVAGVRGDVTLTDGVVVLAACGQVGCAEGDVLELWAESDVDGTSITPVSGTFAVTRI